MKARRLIALLAGLCMGVAQCLASDRARWISAADAAADGVGTWSCFRQDVVLDRKPSQAIAQICVDSKYWLWINGTLAVYEGNLKRGEAPGSIYYDNVDLAPWLRKGRNRIAVLVWHFGKSGFSHADSGRSGLYFSCPEIDLYSGEGWMGCLHPAYGICGEPEPNFRLPESNIRFDQRLDIPHWQTADPAATPFAAVEVSGGADAEPWGKMVARPIPMWKDYGLKKLSGWSCETLADGRVKITAPLPQNMQMSVALEVEDAAGGSLINIETDHVRNGEVFNNRAEYITAPGRHRYESLGWLTAENIVLTMPAGVTLRNLWYRRTGYDTAVEGTFSCSSDFINRFWQKALNTLYINMRDTFYDCPERERAQWWGDITTMMGECFYTYDLNVHQLLHKAIRELCLWAYPDGRLHAPVPGNYKVELPDQMLTSVGLYGFWTYYMNTGDRETIEFAYPYVRRYLDVFSLDADGLVKIRYGSEIWNWGDWGSYNDLVLIFSGWYYMALESAARMAALTGNDADVASYRERQGCVAAGFEKCWNGSYYRHRDHVGRTDDRVQALAVVSGIAGSDKYDAIFSTLQQEENASPYMEKYVLEALFKMGHGDYALQRFQRRFSPMVDDAAHCTLYEGWNPDSYGTGTVNHAWSGGPLTVVASQVCGIRVTAPGFAEFEVAPAECGIDRWSISFPTVAGTVAASRVPRGDGCLLKVTVPEGSAAVVRAPEGWRIRGAADSSCQKLSGGRHRVRLERL